MMWTSIALLRTPRRRCAILVAEIWIRCLVGDDCWSCPRPGSRRGSRLGRTSEKMDGKSGMASPDPDNQFCSSDFISFAVPSLLAAVALSLCRARSASQGSAVLCRPVNNPPWKACMPHQGARCRVCAAQLPPCPDCRCRRQQKGPQVPTSFQGRPSGKSRPQ